MLTIGEALLSLLKDGSPPAIAAPVYARRAPQNVKAPFVKYQQVGRDGIADSLDGPSDLVQRTFQFDSYADGYHAAHQLADQVSATLNGKRLTISVGSPSQTLRIGAIRLVTEYDLDEDDVDPKLDRVLQEYLVTFVEN